LQDNFTLLGYQGLSCNCSWAFLTLLGAVLGNQVGRFSLWGAHFPFSATASLVPGKDSAEFSPSSKIASSTLSSKLNNGVNNERYMVITGYEVM
jgi:hypothetical protein